MQALNYHHLRYFWFIANEGSLTRAAELLRIAPSALSTQLRQLEENLGQQLFDREHKSLVLTEAGRIAHDYAESIFRTGDELLDTLANRAPQRRQFLRVGSVSTLSRNFQMELLKPFIDREEVELIVRTGSMRMLLAQLEAHAVDVVLSNFPVPSDAGKGWQSHLLDDQRVSLVGPPGRSRKRFRFPTDLEGRPLLLPSRESNIRASFDLLLEEAGVRPIVAAEVDDMAMLRLLARESHALTLVPRVVVQDELKNGELREVHRISSIRETFYAITPARRFPNQLTRELIQGWKHLRG